MASFKSIKALTDEPINASLILVNQKLKPQHHYEHHRRNGGNQTGPQGVRHKSESPFIEASS
jgi:hypothetical protein